METINTTATNPTVPVRKHRKHFDFTRLLVLRDRLPWFWFAFTVVVLLLSAIDRYHIISQFKQRERVVIIDPAGTYYLNPLLQFSEAKDLHIQQAELATMAYDGKPLVSDFNDYEIQIEEAFRFNTEDTLVFRIGITNKSDASLIYQPDSFALRAGSRLYPQSISDANGTVPPRSQSIVYFAVTGTPDGGRNELSLRNAFTVLLTRLSPPPPAPVSTITHVPSVHPLRSPRGHL